MNARLAGLLLTASVAGALVASAGAAVADSSEGHIGAQEERGTAISSSRVTYATPAVRLMRADGKPVSLPGELDDGRPVVMNFIFTTCSSICPLASQTFAEFARELGPDASTVHLVSISVDPEQDTPARLTEYAHKYHAGSEWQFYTGTVDASLSTQRAFDVYRGDKMMHTPVTLLRAAPGQPWLRLEGFVTPNELLHAYRALLAAR